MAQPTSPPESGEERFSGLPVSPGVAFGPIEFVHREFEQPRAWAVPAEETDAEWRRFEDALRRTREQIGALKAKLEERGASGEAHVFDAHLLVLEDQTVMDEVAAIMRRDQTNAERAFFQVMSRYIDSLRRVGDPYLRERAIDIEDVAQRVIANLLESGDAEEHTPPASIIFAHDLTPSDTVDLDRRNLLGFATELGSFTSHTAIMARSLNLPGVVGLGVPLGSIHPGMEAILDGYQGLLILRPSPETVAEYRVRSAQQKERGARLDELKDQKAVSADGKRVILSANIEFGHEVDLVKAAGAEGVGLYRTEFFFFQEHQKPDEERQTQVYARAGKAVHPDGVIIRTLDVGGDKFFGDDANHQESNPFLGLRGIRVSLMERASFKTQLRAILRASAEAKLRVMYPMISGLEELRAAHEILAECREELRREGRPFDENLEVGCMIELPSAALSAHQLAPEVDFFSVGTNDLIQYTIAVDRVNERVAHLYQPGHPAILRLLKMIVDAAHEHGIWAGVCGEMAGDVLFTAMLLGLGYDELSVAAGQLPRVKHALRRLDSAECAALVDELSRLKATSEIVTRLRALATGRFGELLTW